MRKAYKSLISLSVVLIAGLNFIVPAFAQDPFTAIAIGGLSGASGAGLFSSMAAASGVNIGWGNSGSDPLDAMWNVLNPDHVYFSGEKHEATGIDEDVYDYIEVDIGDWLQAQTDFISEFCSQYNVTDNDSGTVVSDINYNGIPIVNHSGSYYSENFTLVLGTNTVSDISIYIELIDGKYYYTIGTSRYIIGRTPPPYVARFGWNSGSTCNLYFSVDGTSWGLMANGLPLTQSANIPWSSDTVDLSVFNGWESAKVKIPTTVSQLQHGWTPIDFFNELNRIWSGAGEDNIIIENGSDVPPVPPSPIPDTPLGEVPFDDWLDLWGQGIYEQLENQSDALDFIGSNGEDAIQELESIDTNLEDIAETAESIDTNIGVGNGILGGIRSLAQSAVNYLEGIAEHVGELVEEIVEGTETLIAGILNQIPQAFGVIFGPIKQASSIWHYVVEWITSIGAPFQFIWSMASGTSYYVILPVYASLAAAVVLAFFKRFGR